MGKQNDLTVPEKSMGDRIHSIVKSGLSAIPYAGGGVSEIFSALIMPPLEKRKNEFICTLVAKIKELENKCDSFSLESLKDNEQFISSIMYASQIAIRNHQEEKLKALRNAILNSALPDSPKVDLQHMFLNLVDALTASHLKMLIFLDSPPDWIDEKEITVANHGYFRWLNVIIHIFKDYEENEIFYQLILTELLERRLINSTYKKDYYGFDQEREILKSHTTNLGKQFVDFITSPLEKMI